MSKKLSGNQVYSHHIIHQNYNKILNVKLKIQTEKKKISHKNMLIEEKLFKRCNKGLFELRF